jgi:hypothetical protein
MNALHVVRAKVNVPLKQSAKEKKNMLLIPSYVPIAGLVPISVPWKPLYREKKNKLLQESSRSKGGRHPS